MLDTLKRPGYTGINRCYPCTVLNLLLLLVLGSLAALVSFAGAVILVAVGVVAIWLRGYFVPYTPRIGPWMTETLAAVTGREMPSKSSDRSLAGDDVSGDRVVEELLRVGVLESTDGDDLSLSESFRDEWRGQMRKARTLDLDELEQWARTVLHDCDSTGVEAKDQRWSDPYVVVTFESGEESVLRYPIAIAEFAALAALDDRELEQDVRLHSSGPLRGFLSECPLCDTPLDVSRYSGCCGNPRGTDENPGLVCEHCRTVLYKFPG